MLRKLFGLMLLLLVSACGGYTTEQSVGVLQLTEYLRSRFLCWEGTCSYLIQSKLCVTTTKECLEQKSFWIDRPGGTPDPESPPRFAMVVGSTGAAMPDGPGDVRIHRFYDTTSGQRLSCRNCPFDLEGRLAAAEGMKFEWRDERAKTADRFFKSKWQPRTRWSNDGQAMVVVLPVPTGDGLTVSLLGFDGQGITWRDIGSPSTLKGGLSEVSFSPDDRTLAWQSCTPRCALWTYDRSSGAQKQQDIHCAHSNSIHIGWEGSRARVHHAFAKECAAAPG